MPKYKKVDVSEQQLEDLVRQHADAIEDGLLYVDHQRPTSGGRLDLLLVDSGRSLVVAELKVVEDDGMLLQGLDYYDYAATHIEAFARLYKANDIDPSQQVRLFLVAPSFSQTLINRCKWIDAPISLFIYDCLRFEDSEEIVPVFSEQTIPSPPEPPDIPKIDDTLKYITDLVVQCRVSVLLEEVKQWKPGQISMDPIKYGISMKSDGRVFSYLYPRRKHYVLATYNVEDKWTEYPIHGEEDLVKVLPILKEAMERKAK